MGQSAGNAQASNIADVDVGSVKDAPASTEAAGRDHIEYMADMIHELRWLAERVGCPTLAGILDLAHKEAMLETARR